MKWLKSILGSVSRSKLNSSEESFDLDTSSKKPSNFSKYKTLFSFLLLIILVGLSMFSGYQKTTKKTKDAISAEEARISKMKSEPHTYLQYYLEDTTTELTLESCAKLIGHVRETGCSLGYRILMRNFPDESLEYLHDYLKGFECKEYSSPPVVPLEIGDVKATYLLRLGDDKYRYEISILHHDYKPSSFSISKYEPKGKITK